MQLPLEVCQQFGQFAYQNEQQGVETIAAIQYFIEEYQDDSISGNESQETKTAKIERDSAGVVTAAKSVKLLPNMQINLKALIKDAQERSKEATNITTIVIGGVLSDWLMKVGAALYLIQFGIGLTTVKLKSEQAGVLVALHHLCRGELNFEMPLSELQVKMRDNYHFSLSLDELDEVLEDLVDLHCVNRQQNVIYLTEKVVLKES
ncbi:MAG: hypothetical protein DRR00_08360 [Candidatus Parabeggiatoa sp. nov. 3]|nr:MAG: hypothetical protein DRR00_08360 [Gammaproteobacteria bacterium]RKZ66727.1 MAG: hypothetical protein DRQ99_08805 [Gammaproteobacteria bacterium]